MTELAASPSHMKRLPIWARLASIPILALLLLVGLWLFAGQLAPGRVTGSIIVAFAWFAVAYFALRFIKNRWPELNVPLTATYAVLGIAVAFWFAWNTFRDVTVNEAIVVGVSASEMAEGATASSASAGSGDIDTAVAGDAGDTDAPAAATTTDDVEPSEDVASPAPPEPGAAGVNLQVASGDFTALAHGASGTASIVELAEGGKVLTFAELDTDNGPDLRVYLVEGPIDDNGDGGEFVDIGVLKGNKGNQQYELPDDIDVARFDTVVIWCRAFSVGFAAATLAAS